MTAARRVPGIGLAAIALVVAALGACSVGGVNPAAPDSVPATPIGTAAPVSPGDSATPGDSSTPGATPAIPGDTAAPTPGGTATPGTAAPVSCTSGVVPRRIGRVTVDPTRTTEVSTVVSDGRTITPGTTEQSEFLEPVLTGPDGAQVKDPNLSATVAALIEDNTRNTVLLTRPEPPDARADAARRPYNTPGTYALYNASGPLQADVIVLCGGQEQRWTFTAEGNPSTGVVNCAVEPGRSNVTARSVYQTKC